MSFRPFTLLAEKLPEIAREYVVGVGAIASAWAHLEMAIELLMVVDAQLSGSKKRMPLSFKGKITRLTESLMEGRPHIAAYKRELMQIVVLGEQASNKRHLLTHGAVLGTFSENELKLMRVAKQQVVEKLVEEKVSIHEMWIMLEMIGETAGQTYNVLIRMVRDFLPEGNDVELALLDVSKFRWPEVHAGEGR